MKSINNNEMVAVVIVAHFDTDYIRLSDLFIYLLFLNYYYLGIFGNLSSLLFYKNEENYYDL